VKILAKYINENEQDEAFNYKKLTDKEAEF
jgi:hypothetical protein